MKTKGKLLWTAIGCILAVALAIVAYAMSVSNDLGLTRADLAIGGFPDVEVLRAKTKSVADAYLAQHEADLKELCGGSFQLTSDASLSGKARELGYRSSFYYYCWNVYLPYSLRPNSGSPCTILVQLSDGTAGHQHDPDKFRVLRTIVINQKGLIQRTLE